MTRNGLLGSSDFRSIGFGLCGTALEINHRTLDGNASTFCVCDQRSNDSTRIRSHRLIVIDGNGTLDV